MNTYRKTYAFICTGHGRYPRHPLRCTIRNHVPDVVEARENSGLHCGRSPDGKAAVDFESEASSDDDRGGDNFLKICWISPSQKRVRSRNRIVTIWVVELDCSTFMKAQSISLPANLSNHELRCFVRVAVPVDCT